MQISGPVASAGCIVLGAGMLVGGICLAGHAIHLPHTLGSEVMCAGGIAMALLGVFTSSLAFTILMDQLRKSLKNSKEIVDKEQSELKEKEFTYDPHHKTKLASFLDEYL